MFTADWVRHKYLIKTPGFSCWTVGVLALQFQHYHFLGSFANRRLKKYDFLRPAVADKLLSTGH